MFIAQCILAIVLGIADTILFYVIQSPSMAGFSEGTLFVSVVICAYVCFLRRKIQAGKIGEMGRGLTGPDVEEQGTSEVI